MNLLDAYPDTSEHFKLTGKSELAESMRLAVETGKPDTLELRYDLEEAGEWVVKFWLATHYPIIEDGKVVAVYQETRDVTNEKQVGLELDRTLEQQAFLAHVTKELVSSLDMRKLLTKITKLSVPTIADWCSVDLYFEETGFEQVSVAHTDPKKLSLAKQYRQHNPLHIDDDTAIPRMLRTGQPEFYPVITNAMIDEYIEDEEQKRFMMSLNLHSMMILPLRQGKKVIGGISFVSSDSGRNFDDGDFRMAGELASRISLSLTNARLYNDSKRDLVHRRELEKQLRVEKQTLESRVKERTRQLQLTNQGLRDEILRRQSAEKVLNEYSTELTRSNKELEDFAYVASHDLQEPLRKIQAFGNLLLAEYGDELGPEGADYLKRMHSAASRMSTLIEDLLTFSRVTRKERGNQDVDLNGTLRDVMSDLEARTEDTGAKVSIGKLPTISADPTHMRQLFQNLIGNAVKFHKPDTIPVVTVRSRVKHGGFEISIKDNGVGFDEKYLDRIFAVFQRLHERSSYEGTGIGLAVCRKIVERYDGTITATSSKGEGSTFVVWLPSKKGKK
jgi:signal transduction histidine kinase